MCLYFRIQIVELRFSIVLLSSLGLPNDFLYAVLLTYSSLS
jgi:hypothetical protein